MASAKSTGYEPHTEFVRWLVDWVELDWDEELVTGDALLDRQHKDLFELTRQLVAARDGAYAADELQAALARLRQHAIAHFVVEEALLLQHDVPGAAQHIASHDEFRRLIAQCEQALACSDGDHVARASGELESWIRSHVRNDDREALAFLRGAA